MPSTGTPSTQRPRRGILASIRSDCSLTLGAPSSRVVAPLLRLYPFKFRDPATGCWTKARYKATLNDIGARYAEWMIDGEPEIRGSIPPASSFNPYRASPPLGSSDVDM